MYTQSVPALISKNVGNTLSNFVTWNDVIYNVRKFGARGDGVTDDTGAITSALNAAKENGGGIVRFPPGNYKVSSRITVPEKIKLEGSGIEVTTITSTLTNDAAFYCPNNYFTIESMTIIGPDEAAVSGCRGIYTYNSGNGAITFWLKNLFVKHFHDNIVIESSLNSYLNDIIVSNARNIGIAANGGQGKWNNIAVFTSISHGVFLNSSTTGLNPAAPFITNLETFANGGYGIYTKQAIQLMNSFVNNDSLGGIRIETSISQSGYISGCILQYCGQNPFANGPYYPNVPNAPGIVIIASSGQTIISDLMTFSNNGIDIDDFSGKLILSNSFFQGSGAGGVAGETYALRMNSGYGDICNIRAEKECVFKGNHNKIVGSRFFNNSATIPTVHFSGAQSYVIFSENWIYNGAGGGTAILADTNTQLLRQRNLVQNGAITDNGLSPHTASW